MAGFTQLQGFDAAYNKPGVLAGVDEAGRGPWAGPVVVAAVILDPAMVQTLRSVNDSKKITEKKRESLYDIVVSACLTYSITEASNKVIDSSNILKVTLDSMAAAVRGLKTAPQLVLIDGNKCPQMEGVKLEAVVDGDAKSLSIAAASILAKVHRDRLMRNFDREYPGYGFAAHKGYGTKKHMEALEKKGITPIHRVSYKPVKQYLKPV
ncbi:MAG: ribonuclease HII [Spirochaetia bacterium]|nr:ribonuclease HII [Spirochaetia bacterium]